MDASAIHTEGRAGLGVGGRVGRGVERVDLSEEDACPNEVCVTLNPKH